MKYYKISVLFVLATMLACACGNKSSKPAAQVVEYQKVSPDFDADSAYHFVQKQVDFGPRVPNTKEHIACANYLAETLKRFGAEVIEQKAVLTAYNGTKLNAVNIIGSYSPDKKNRVLLFAHWDSRPYADADADSKNHNTPIDGANDGASGVGVLLEVARQIQIKSPEVGVDIIFFDAEDYGVPSFAEAISSDNSWCLGSQYWAENPHVKGYKAKFGILLDMVGAKDATFYRDAVSKRYASNVIEKVWSTARQLGYGKFFISADGGYIMDDHVPVNQVTRIPSIDILDYKISDTHDGFFPHWHTINDTMDNIDKETLKAVGQTVLEVIYKEK